MKIRVERFKREHVRHLEDPATEPGLLSTLAVLPSYWAQIEAAEFSYSAFFGDVFLGAGGFGIVWPGVAEAWLWALPSVHEHPIRVHRFVHQAIKSFMSRFEIRRLSVEVREGNTPAERWMRILGFKWEASMKRRGPDGSTFSLFSIVR